MGARLLVVVSFFSGGCFDFSMLGKSPCVTDTTAFCEDFESGALDSSRWRPPFVSTMSSLTVDKTTVHSGQFSLHAKAADVAAVMNTSATDAPLPTFTPSPSLFVRAFYYQPELPGGHLVAYFAPGKSDIDLFATHGSLASFDGLVSGGMRTISTQSMPTAKWTCIELEFDTLPVQQIRLFVDGKEVPDLHVVEPTLGTPPLSELSFGAGVTGVQRAGALPLYDHAAEEEFIDDIVVSTTGPIGCGDF